MARWFLLLLTGCSLTLSGPRADRPRNTPPACDTSKGLVVLDSLIAATLGIVAVSVAAGNNGGEAVGPLLVGGLFAGAAIHGNNVVNACHRENASFDAEQANRALPPDPDRELAPRPAIAMSPAVALPSVAAAPPPPRSQLPPAPQPMPSMQPPSMQEPPMQPAPMQPAPAAAPPQQPPPPQQPMPPRGDDPWSAFWKEVP